MGSFSVTALLGGFEQVKLLKLVPCQKGKGPDLG